MKYLSFPGLGIEPFHIDKVAFTLFGRDIVWYGVIITIGMMLAVLCGSLLSKRERIKADDIIDLAFFVIIFGVLGARIYYVIFTWSEMNYIATGGTFFENLWDTFYNIIAIWEGGLAIYGGIIAGMITAVIFAKVKKLSFVKLFDIMSPCVLIGQTLGRWGNFINIEAYGGETTLPWRMGILYSYSGKIMEEGMWDLEKYVHPTFLYESLWNLVGLAIVLLIYRKKKFDGQICSTYFMWYGFGRMIIEGLRTDSLMLGPIRVSQLVGLISLIAGLVLMIFFSKRNKANADKKENDYVPVYEGINIAETEDSSPEGTGDTDEGENDGTHN